MVLYMLHAKHRADDFEEVFIVKQISQACNMVAFIMKLVAVAYLYQMVKTKRDR